MCYVKHCLSNYNALFLATTSCSSLKIHKDISKYSSFSSVYCTISSRVRSVIPFVKVAYPDMMGSHGHNQPEPLNKMERTACRFIIYVANSFFFIYWCIKNTLIFEQIFQNEIAVMCR